MLSIRQVIFFGMPNVGKTSLTSVLTGQDFNSQYVPTIGNEFKFKTVDENKLELWDTQSNVLHSILIEVLREKNDIGFVIDATARLEGQINYVIELINQCCKNASFSKPPRYFIITNKAENLDPNINILLPYKKKLREETGVKFSYFTVSAKTNLGLNTLDQFLFLPFKEPKYTKNYPPNIFTKSVSGPHLNSTQANVNFVALIKFINKTFYRRYIGTIKRPWTLFKLPFSIWGIGPNHMNRAKDILKDINTKAKTFEQVNAILTHEQALLLRREPPHTVTDLITNPIRLNMVNVPEDADTSGYYRVIEASLEQLQLLQPKEQRLQIGAKKV